MTWTIQGFPNTAGSFSWTVFSTYDLRDDVRLELHILTPDEFSSATHALRFLSQQLWSGQVDWIDPFPHDRWTFDFDRLRTLVAGAEKLPGWLHGRRQAEPSISSSFAFLTGGVSSDTASPTALPATNLDSARADGLKVSLSHAVSVLFFEVDPFAALEELMFPKRSSSRTGTDLIPNELKESVDRFRSDQNGLQTAFLMMKFGKSKAHARIVDTITSALQPMGVKVVRADQREYHSDLFQNILTYAYGSAFGIAVFERLDGDEFNPNVSLEVGYCLGIGKKVCLLKDQTLRGLHTDLVGKLYRNFDPQDPEETIPSELTGWLNDWADVIGIKPSQA